MQLAKLQKTNNTDKMKTPTEYLQENGWTQYKDHLALDKSARFFAKRFNTPTRCACNDDKDGMQVCIRVTNRAMADSFEMTIRGELPDGTWIEFLNYSMPENIEEVIAKIPRLLAAWEIMADYPIPATHSNRQARFEIETHDSAKND
jgi:hypothetical protein